MNSKQPSSDHPVVIVGAGLSGLTCARTLHEAGVPVLVIESADAVGGRVRTDEIDGFRLDRGFQVFLDSYPEARRMLDYEALDLRPFSAGALIRVGDHLHRIADPWKDPIAGVLSLFKPVMTLHDAQLIWKLRRECLRGHNDRDSSTLEFLKGCGFSAKVIDRFFRPFFGGVFLDRELHTSSRFFKFVFGMFATGSATVPAEGMQRIPEQLASGLPKDAIRLNTRVVKVDGDAASVHIEGGERISASFIVSAAEFDQSARLLDLSEEKLPARDWNATTTVYYGAARAPVREPILVLNANRNEGPVDHLAVMSNAVPGYAPSNRALISVSITTIPDESDDAIDRAIREQLRTWFGVEVNDWSLLRVDRIRRALPRLLPAADTIDSKGFFEVGDRAIACGDAFDTPSINGAMRSGRLAAEEILRRLQATTSVKSREHESVHA